MNWPITLVVAVAAMLALPAQDPPSATEQRDRARLEERAQSMRAQIDGGKRVDSHVRVLVRLKNGNKLRGVVKDGRLVERVDGLRFVEAQAQEQGAGVRLWYSSGARNYVFVPFTDFAEYHVLQRLTSKQLEEIENEMHMEESRKAEREAAAARAAGGEATAGATVPAGEEPANQDGAASDGLPPAPAQEPGQGAAPGKGRTKAKDTKAAGAGSAKVETDLQRKWFELLQNFPPGGGWSKGKRDEIARRMAVVGAKPSDVEQRFLDQFAEWEKACKHFGLEPEAKVEAPADAAGAAATEPTGRRKKK